MKHSQAAEVFNRDEVRTDWHSKIIWSLRQRRDLSAQALPEWENLRNQAENIKQHMLSKLDDYLIQFEENAIKNGIKVYWAKDAESHNRIVYEILSNNHAKKIVKSKSMLQEECHMNPYLESRGIEVIDTDLGERIVQLANQTPSHVVAPAVHFKKEDVSELFHEKLGTEKGTSNIEYLVESTRKHLREKFLQADAAMTGVNFGVAETGGIVIATNEGNADLGTALPKLHIASMGIEKLVPKLRDLGVFIRLLARSATGQAITVYTSHYHGPPKEKELHLVMVDNGRSDLLGKKDFRKSLQCIRCGACLNTCPVYRRSGGHSYGYIIPGPIGSSLGPFRDLKENSDLPFASTLCGSCTNVCPVKVDLHDQLFKWRQEVVKAGLFPLSKNLGIKTVGTIMSSPFLYNLSSWILRKVILRLPRFLLYSKLNSWGKQRELPQSKRERFRDWYANNRGKK